MDEDSVLGDAIDYLEYLQDRVTMLEEQASNRTTGPAPKEDTGDNNDSNEQRLEIEARVCNNNILIKIQCEKGKGVLVKVLGEVDKFDLTVVNISVAPFGSLALDITIVAEVNYKFVVWRFCRCYTWWNKSGDFVTIDLYK